jgi:putative oxidoreductase
LALRLVVGTAFMYHGWGKIQKGPFEWMDRPDHPGPPAFLQALAAFSEFGGGLALVLGLLTPLAALLIGGTMVGALAMVHLPMGHPFVNAQGGPSFELAAVYLAAMILFLLVGPGTLSADWCLFHRKPAPGSPAGSPP